MTRTKRRRSAAQPLLLTLVILIALGVSTHCVLANLPQAASLPDVPRRTEAAAAPGTAGAAAEDADWALRLVNPWNALPQDYTVTLVQLRNGQAVDERCYPDLQAMMDACRAAGLSPLICSSWRSWEDQAALYQSKVAQFEARGYDRDSAEAEAGQIVAVPGTSEHQLGLAVDIVDESYQHLDEAQARTAVQQWLLEHCWEYGFVLRYPPEKSGLTGIIYEPWHYRYVGRVAARAMRQQDVCLEEYLASAELA
ncbi:MAG: M15 family metallopeptidase [Oscillospiraceae bacterium]|nr:M15 family metallopeptidase [Oscillospiraceae bacterium]